MLAMLLPPSCPVCGRAGAPLCRDCWARLKRSPPAPPPDDLVACRSLLVYQGAGRELLARLKYRNRRDALTWLASGMADLARPLVDRDALVTWVPTSAARRHARGFDQAELLARSVARGLRLPVAAVLRRGDGPAQTGRAGSERATGVAITARRLPRCSRLLLVDDVVTTGATLSAAARAVHNVSSTEVVAVTAARTPLKVVGGSADA